MPNLGAPEILMILLVVLLLFGSAKLPQLARSLGKSARILKAETKGLHDDGDEQPAQPQQAQAQGQAQTQAQGQTGQSAPPAYQASSRRQLPPGSDDEAAISGVPISEAERRRQNF